ncbi:MAG: DUF2142 domain-containing protein, partial [Planctomycetota bacterium]
ADTVFGPIVNEHFGQPDEAGRHLHFVHGGDERPPRAKAAWALIDLRLISVVMGLLSLLCMHALGRACCPERPRIADTAVLLVSCLPMWSFLHGVLNSDDLATLLATATLLALVRLSRSDAPTLRSAMAIGLLLGLALLTKLTTLFLAPLAAITFAVVGAREVRAGRSRRALQLVGTAFVTATAISGWWFVRNLQLYGDPLAMQVHDASFPGIADAYVWPYFWNMFLPNVFASLLGCFGWFSLPPHPVLYWGGAAFTLLALIGLARLACERAVPKPQPMWLLLAACVLVFAGTAHFNLKVPQPQGRLLFPAIGPAAVLLAAGLVRITEMLHISRCSAWLRTLPPLTAGVVLLAWFMPAFDPALAPAPAHLASLVGDIVEVGTRTSITWLEPAPGTTTKAPPTLRWSVANDDAAKHYTLYAYDEHNRVWLASYEWSHGLIVLQGGEAVVPAAAWSLLPTDRDVFLKLRRVPDWRAGERLGDVPVSAPLRIRRQ